MAHGDELRSKPVSLPATTIQPARIDCEFTAIGGAFAASVADQSMTLFMDSGASRHMVQPGPSCENIHDLETPVSITTASGSLQASQACTFGPL